MMSNSTALAVIPVILLLVVIIIQSPVSGEVSRAGYDDTPNQVERSSSPHIPDGARYEMTGSERKPAENPRTTRGDNLSGEENVSVQSDVRIKLTFGDEEVVVRMHDNPTTRDLLALLPLTVDGKDYAGTEKIARLPGRLSTKDAPAGNDPSVGDLSYYSPWGNLAIFYRDSGYADGLIILGSMESGGIEKIARMKEDFTITLERTG